MKVLVLKKSAHPVNQLILELNRPNLKPKAEAPVQQFQRELKENARAALQSNRDRLNQQQQQGQSNPGWGNLAIAGLDVGMQPEVMRGLVKIPGLVRSAASLGGEQLRVLMRSLAQVQGQVSEAVVQKMVQGVKQADQLTTSTIVNPDGSLSQSRPLGEVSDRLEARGQVRASGQTKKAPKTLDAYLNADAVKPFIGTKVDPNNLPPGYQYGKIPTGTDKAGNETFREVVYMPESDSTKVPLKLDKKGRIQQGKEGEYRIVNKTAYDKNVETVPGKSGKLLGGKSEVHHMFADNLLRGTPFGQRALELGAVNPDAAINTIELANSLSNLEKARKAHPNIKFSDFVHNTQHPKFDELMQEVFDEQITLLRKEKGLSGIGNPEFIPQITKEEIQAVWNRSLKRMKRGFMGEDTQLYKEIEKRTRPGKKSLAQGKNPDNSEFT
jgi:hypothetical protein